MLAINDLLSYLRIDRWPTVWCPGCGNGIILKAILQSIHNLSLRRDRVAVISGIGCSSRATGYIDFNTMHTLHGRAIAFATGVKLSRPEFNVIVLGGDGDLLSIGGNHFIHACRRNVDITVIVFNNMIYGMTGGQNSPTTPKGKIASTAPCGNFETPIDVVKLAKAAGATYIARSTVYHYTMLTRYLTRAIQHRGMAVVDVVTNCHTYFGRYNKMPEPAEMLEYFKSNSVTIEKSKTLTPEELSNKIVIGEFESDESRPTFYEMYEHCLKDASGGE